MARPRVFISSTYFDFKSVREDLDRFVASLGYEPVRHERAQISYGKDESPERYVYREIELCDILVSIVGSKFGSLSSEGSYSISQRELKRAHELGKQVYIFVEKGVLSEFKLYQANKALEGITYTQVDDKRIYGFVEEVYALSSGNPIFPFETGADITEVLRTQWSGMFQRLLSQEEQKKQSDVLAELQRSLATVDQMVKFLMEEKTRGADALDEILFANHPLFAAMASRLSNKYRLYFTSVSELDDWLTSARSYISLGEDAARADVYEWYKLVTLKSGQEEYHFFSVAKSLFDAGGKLKPMTQAAWSDGFITLLKLKKSELEPETVDTPAPNVAASSRRNALMGPIVRRSPGHK